MNTDKETIIQSILKSTGLVLIVGPSDSGKTTTAKYLLSKLCLFRSKIGFIDGDMGQSTLGPPGTIGAATFSNFDPQKNWEQQAQHLKLSFIGVFSPVGHILELILSLQKMVDYLTLLGCDIILVDTTGLVQNRLGLYLKKSKIDLLKPSQLILFQKKDELHTLIRMYATAHNITLHVRPITEEVKKRSMEHRNSYREKKITEYFKGSSFHKIPFSPIIHWKKDIISSTFLSPDGLAQLSSILQKEINFAAITHRILLIATDTWFYCNMNSMIKKIFPVDSIYILLKQRLISKYISLEDSNKNVLGLGVVKDIDFRNHSMIILSPPINMKKIYCIKFGDTNLNFLVTI